MTQLFSHDEQLFDLTQVQPDMPAAGDDALTLATYVVTAFVNAVRANRYYPPEHPLHADFQHKLYLALQRYLDYFPCLTLEISELTFAVKGEVLATSTDLKASIPFIFYRDGIRELRFLHGVEERELCALMDTIRQSDQVNKRDDDLVTLLWERDFACIDFLAIDTYLDGTALPVVETVEDFRVGMPAEPPAHQVMAELSAWTNGEVPAEWQALFSAPLLTSDRSLYRLTPEETQTLLREVQQETDTTATFQAAVVLLDMLPTLHDPAVAQVALDLLQAQLRAMLDLGEFRRAGALLLRLETLLADGAVPETLRTALRQLPDGISTVYWHTLLADCLRQQGADTPAEIARLLALMPASRLSIAMAVLARLSEPAQRAPLLDWLLAQAARQPEIFAPFLANPDTAQVCDAVTLLASLREERMIPYLAKALEHRQPEVRQAVARVVAQIPGTPSLRLLHRALHDGEERVRRQAADTLGTIGGEAARNVLLPFVQDRNFRKRAPGEMQAMLVALGRCGEALALEVLQELLTHRAMFGRGKSDILRGMAAQALAAIGTPEARVLLEEGRQAKDAAVRAACQQAVQADKERT